MNIFAAPVIVGTALRRRPRIRNHFRLDTLADMGGGFAREEDIFSLLAYGRVRTWLTVLISHPSTVFFMYHLVSPFVGFFNDMG